MTAARTRMTAEERREQVVAAALERFAEGGYHGTSTEAIAREVGVSQPYLFRLFGTKRELFLACIDALNARIIEAFERAADGLPPEERLPAMGRAYMELLADRTLLLAQHQTFAATSDPVVRAAARRGYADVVAAVRRLSGADEPTVWSFCATGMLLNVLTALDLSEAGPDEHWKAEWCNPAELLQGRGE